MIAVFLILAFMPLVFGMTERRDISEDILSSLAVSSIQVCDGDRRRLVCPKGTIIAVEQAFYGRLVPSSELCPSQKVSQKDYWHQEQLDCHVPEAQQRISNRCNNRRHCKLTAKPRLFGLDPCKDTSKYLQVSYKCKPSQFANEQYCDGSQMEILCNKGDRITLYSASYGVRSSEMSHCHMSTHLDCSSESDVLSILVSRCQARQNCSLRVGATSFGPQSCLHSYLSVHYACVTKAVFNPVVVDRFSTVRLPDPDPPRIVPTTPQSVRPVIPPVINTKPISTSTNPMNDGTKESYSFHEKSIRTTLTTTLSVPRDQSNSNPNAIGFLENFMVTWRYLVENKEKSLLYFFVSASAGVIVLLTFCIIYQLRSRSGKRVANGYLRGQSSSTPGSMRPPSLSTNREMTPTDLSEFGSDGLFTRWNNPAPPSRNGHAKIPQTPLPSASLASSNPPSLTRYR